MPRASTKQFPARLDEMLIDETVEVQLSVVGAAPPSPSRNRSRNKANDAQQPSRKHNTLRTSSPQRHNVREDRAAVHQPLQMSGTQPHQATRDIWVPPPLTIPETNPRRPVELTDLRDVLKGDDSTYNAKAAALFEIAVHSEKGMKKFHSYRAKAVSRAPDSEVPAFVQLADKYREQYRQHRPRIYRHSYHTGLCDDDACNDALLVPHICCFPCAVQGLYDAINDPGFTPCTVPCQAALFALFPCSWPVFCCAQAYVLRSKLNLIFGVRESYHLLAKSFFCSCCLTASMHREIELRRVPVLIRTPFSSAPQRVYESELLAPDIAHMGACGELVIPLPSPHVGDYSSHSNPSSIDASDRENVEALLDSRPTQGPPDAEFSFWCCCSWTAPYNSSQHLLFLGLFVPSAIASAIFDLLYFAVCGTCCALCKSCGSLNISTLKQEHQAQQQKKQTKTSSSSIFDVMDVDFDGVFD